MIKHSDFLVETRNPQGLDATLLQLGAALVGAPDYIQHEGCYVMRVFGDPGFIKFACEHQGYCKIIRQIHMGLDDGPPNSIIKY